MVLIIARAVSTSANSRVPDSLPADPRFVLPVTTVRHTILSPVSLKDVVMSRACSSSRNDLNRDPAVRRTYVRNSTTGRLESNDVSVSPTAELNGNGKRKSIEAPIPPMGSSKRARKTDHADSSSTDSPFGDLKGAHSGTPVSFFDTRSFRCFCSNCVVAL